MLRRRRTNSLRVGAGILRFRDFPSGLEARRRSEKHAFLISEGSSAYSLIDALFDARRRHHRIAFPEHGEKQAREKKPRIDLSSGVSTGKVDDEEARKQ